MSVNEGKKQNCSQQSDMNRQKPTTLDSKRQDADEDDDNLNFSLPAIKAVGEFEERFEWLQKDSRDILISYTREEVQHNTQSAFTPVRSQGKCSSKSFI